MKPQGLFPWPTVPLSHCIKLPNSEASSKPVGPSPDGPDALPPGIERCARVAVVYPAALISSANVKDVLLSMIERPATKLAKVMLEGKLSIHSLVRGNVALQPGIPARTAAGKAPPTTCAWKKSPSGFVLTIPADNSS